MQQPKKPNLTTNHYIWIMVGLLFLVGIYMPNTRMMTIVGTVLVAGAYGYYLYQKKQKQAVKPEAPKAQQPEPMAGGRFIATECPHCGSRLFYHLTMKDKSVLKCYQCLYILNGDGQLVIMEIR